VRKTLDTTLGFVQTQMEASLALGEIQTTGPNPTAGRVVLQRLAKDARAKGFALIAKKASTALESGSAEWFLASHQNPGRP